MGQNMPTANDLPALAGAVRELREAVFDPKSVCTEEEASNPAAYPDSWIVSHRGGKVQRLLRDDNSFADAADISDPSIPLPLQAKLARLYRVIRGYEFGYLDRAWRDNQRPELLLFLDEVIDALQSRGRVAARGAPLRYSLKVWEYARGLQAESSPKLTAKEIMVKCKRRFPQQPLPANAKAFREWLKTPKKKAR
jgi:hypothetical protein